MNKSYPILIIFLALLIVSSASMATSRCWQDAKTEADYHLYPLGEACRDGNLAAVKQILSSAEEEPMAMSNEYYEFDVLYAAVHYDRKEILRYALTLYRDVNDRLYSDEYGLTLLTYACKRSNVRLCRILLEHGIDVNGSQSPDDTYKVYPIMEAIANKNTQLVKLLLAYRANLCITDSNNHTPFSLAQEVGAKDIEELLERWEKQEKE